MSGLFLVTGGAGFIGSNLVRSLLSEGNKVVVFDNLSTGKLSNLPIDHLCLTFVHLDLKQPFDSWPTFNFDRIFHLSANADVRGGISDRNIDFIENTMVTKSLCEYAVKISCPSVVFASSATIYGEPSIFPTPESCQPPQTSLYGASKKCCESMLEAYSSYGHFKVTIFRFVSWIGYGYSHGVIYDFVKKLLANPYRLEVLGDGRQIKSYLDVSDGISGILTLTASQHEQLRTFNLGHSESIDVVALAHIIFSEMNLPHVPELVFSGGKRGWIGDSPTVILDTAIANNNGWSPCISIEAGIRRTVRYLLDEPGALDRD